MTQQVAEQQGQAQGTTATVDQAAAAVTAAAAPDPNPAELGDPGKRALEAERTARKAAEKATKDLQRELDTQRTASLSDAERAVAEAKNSGRSEALAEVGQMVARAKFDAIAARRNPTLDDNALDELLEFVDMKRFLADDGTADIAAITKAAERLIPEATSGPAAPAAPNYDLGPRQVATTAPTDAAGRIAAGLAEAMNTNTRK